MRCNDACLAQITINTLHVYIRILSRICSVSWFGLPTAAHNRTSLCVSLHSSEISLYDPKNCQHIHSQVYLWENTVFQLSKTHENNKVVQCKHEIHDHNITSEICSMLHGIWITLYYMLCHWLIKNSTTIKSISSIYTSLESNCSTWTL